MDTELHILIAEDSGADAALMEDQLRQANISFVSKRVETEQDFRKELREFSPHVILSDYLLPAFSGVSALEIVQQSHLDTPFIFVSGAIGEEVAVETLKGGATDYVLKSKLSRLAPAVCRAVREAEDRVQRKRAEAAVVEWKNRYEAAVLASGHVLYDWHLQEDTVTYGGNVERMLGYAGADLAGGLDRRVELVHSEDRPIFKERIGGVIATKEPFHLEYRIRRKDGSYIIAKDDGYFVSGLGGGSVRMVGLIVDVSEQRRIEQELRQAQKMDALGRLAGGIAHDFNNLLTAILGYSTLLLRRPSHDDDTRQEITRIKEAAERAASLTRQLLAFTRQQVLSLEVVNLNAVLSDTEKLLRRLVSERIELLVAPASSLGCVRADLGQIQQVILNLVINARDAMPHSGQLTIETKDVSLAETDVANRLALKPGRYAMLAVSDSGCGMDKETQDRIFEPFFTTKANGKGTGLGLSTVYGIVKQSGGDICVCSELEHGTRFEVYLPIVEEPTKPPEPSKLTSPGRGSETILVVEDERKVRSLVRRILEAEGYRVLEAEGGDEALLICRRYGGAIHLLLTDVIMPRMNGRELAGRLASLCPTLKVIYMSGYAGGVIADGEGHLIEKPFTPEAIVRKVGEVLHPHNENEL